MVPAQVPSPCRVVPPRRSVAAVPALGSGLNSPQAGHRCPDLDMPETRVRRALPDMSETRVLGAPRPASGTGIPRVSAP